MMGRLLYALTILSFVISGCATNTAPNQDTSVSVGDAESSQNYLSIRIDWIKIKGETAFKSFAPTFYGMLKSFKFGDSWF